MDQGKREGLESPAIDERFSLYWWDNLGNQYRELYLMPAAEVVARTQSLMLGPAAQSLNIINKIMIEDGGGFSNFEWTSQDGVTFPECQKGWFKPKGKEVAHE